MERHEVMRQGMEQKLGDMEASADDCINQVEHYSQKIERLCRRQLRVHPKLKIPMDYSFFFNIILKLNMINIKPQTKIQIDIVRVKDVDYIC